jgi:hypothetical protein
VAAGEREPARRERPVRERPKGILAQLARPQPPEQQLEQLGRRPAQGRRGRQQRAAPAQQDAAPLTPADPAGGPARSPAPRRPLPWYLPAVPSCPSSTDLLSVRRYGASYHFGAPLPRTDSGRVGGPARGQLQNSRAGPPPHHDPGLPTANAPRENLRPAGHNRPQRKSENRSGLGESPLHL